MHAQFDVAEKSGPAWVQSVIYTDDVKKTQEGDHVKLEGTVARTEAMAAVNEDQTHGHLASSCEVTLRSMTADETYVQSGSESSGGSGGSSSGGSGSKEMTPAGSKTSGVPPLGATVGI